MQNKTLNWVESLRPIGWSRYTLADVCSFMPYSNVKDKGSLPVQEHTNEAERAKARNEKEATGSSPVYPVYLQTKKTRYYFPEHLEKYVLKDAELYTQAEQNDLIICLDGFVTDDGDSVLGRTLTGHKGVLGTGMYKVVIKDAFARYADYIKHALRSPYIRQQIITMARGAIVKHAGYTVNTTVIYLPDNIVDMKRVNDTISTIEFFGTAYNEELNRKIQKKSDARKKLQIALCNTVGALFMESLWQEAILNPYYVFDEARYTNFDI
jgi:hypothetical protein